MRILHLTLKKKWFDMTQAGIKKAEYREIKPYWTKRFVDDNGAFKHFDIVRFKNGYGKDAPTFDIVFKGFMTGMGFKEWGAPDTPVYILNHGNIIK